ncbi:PKD domain-containing protein [Massilia sp. UBA6681]|uniref:PKD domain-containing protein n=1 Tax=Massilia sp. UBA6681 TaxID=1946839 RepID=UPI0025BACAF2|nr:PKD domain-containing protein [Massilia sp. UBA6681]
MRHFSIGRFSTITGMVVLASAVAAGSRAGENSGKALAAPGEQEAHKAGSQGRDVYGIVNLAGGTFGFVADINARGQAAFEYFGLDGLLHVGYFDGARVIDISPPNNRTAFLGDLNDKGEVAFSASIVEPAMPEGTPFRPFRWSASRGLLPLPSLSSDGPTFVTAINNHSEIVGRSALSTENGANRAVRWTAANRLIQLPAPAGIGATYASHINDGNVTVGSGDAAGGAPNVLAWDAAGRTMDLGPFGKRFAFASTGNNRGEIAGMLDTLSPELSAFLWSPGKGAVRIGARTITHGLNGNGEVVGRRVSGNSDPAPRAFLFSRARGLVDLHPRGLQVSEANAANERGVVVGLGQRAPGDNIAYRWTRGGAVDLNTRLLNPPTGLVLHSALAVSNNGDIVASSNAGVVLLRANGGGTDAPVLGPIRHAQPRLNQPLEITLSFRDRNVGDTHSATVDWGDGSGPQVVGLREYRGKGEVRASHTYTSNGDYTIVVRVRDSTGKATQLFEQLTILDLGTPGAQGQGALANAAGAAAHRQLQARALAARLGHGPTQLLR